MAAPKAKGKATPPPVGLRYFRDKNTGKTCEADATWASVYEHRTDMEEVTKTGKTDETQNDPN